MGPLCSLARAFLEPSLQVWLNEQLSSLLLHQLPIPGKLHQENTDAKGSLQEANPLSGAEQGSPLLCPGLHPPLAGA